MRDSYVRFRPLPVNTRVACFAPAKGGTSPRPFHSSTSIGVVQLSSPFTCFLLFFLFFLSLFLTFFHDVGRIPKSLYNSSGMI